MNSLISPELLVLAAPELLSVEALSPPCDVELQPVAPAAGDAPVKSWTGDLAYDP